MQELIEYINSFDSANTYEECKKAISEIIIEFKKMNITKNKMAFFTKLIAKSETLKIILKKIIEELLPLLNTGVLDDFFSDFDELILIETYIALNDINVLPPETEIDNIVYNENTDNTLSSYLVSIGNHKLLSRAEERTICARIALGDVTARDILIKHNLKLVAFFARQLYREGIDIMDLIQEGNIGLIKAAEKFDYTQNNRFISYAKVVIITYIKKYISKNAGALSHSGEIEILKNKYYQLRIIKGKSEEETFKSMGITRKKFEDVKKYFATKAFSMDMYASEEVQKPISAIIPDTSDYFATLQDEQILLRESLYKLFKKANLTDDEIKVVVLYYGIGGRENKPFTILSKEGKFKQKTRFGISLIHNTALNKLRNCPDTALLAQYMDSPSFALKSLEAMKAYLKENKDARYRNFYPDQIEEITRNYLKTAVAMPKSEKQAEDICEITCEEKVEEDVYTELCSQIDEDERLIDLALRYILSRKELSRLSILGYKEVNTDTLISSLKITLELIEEIKSVIARIKERKELIEGLITDDYVDENHKNKLFRLLNYGQFSQIKDKLPKYEMIVLILKLGFIDNKYFSNNAIAAFLGLTETSVSQLISNILSDYHDEVISIIDTRIALLSMPSQSLVGNYAYN